MGRPSSPPISRAWLMLGRGALPCRDPNLSELYRQKVIHLAEALNDEDSRLRPLNASVSPNGPKSDVA
jgi:hypothetical protein